VVPLVLSYFTYRAWLNLTQERRIIRDVDATTQSITIEHDQVHRIEETGRSDEALQAARAINRMLETVDAALARERRFLKEVSHELRTPITICRGHLEVMGPQPSQREVEETVALVLDELRRMGRIVEDLTTLTRLEQSEGLRLAPLRLDAFLTQLGAKATPLLDGRLEVENAPSITIEADHERLTQALMNLLQNAAHHGNGTGRVTLRARAGTTTCRFEVADENGGLRPEVEQDVFLPFVRAHATSAGLGLGLAIVRAIATAHGGAAGVDNRPGEGATFWVELQR